MCSGHDVAAVGDGRLKHMVPSTAPDLTEMTICWARSSSGPGCVAQSGSKRDVPPPAMSSLVAPLISRVLEMPCSRAVAAASRRSHSGSNVPLSNSFAGSCAAVFHVGHGELDATHSLQLMLRVSCMIQVTAGDLRSARGGDKAQPQQLNPSLPVLQQYTWWYRIGSTAPAAEILRAARRPRNDTC